MKVLKLFFACIGVKALKYKMRLQINQVFYLLICSLIFIDILNV